MIVKVEGIQIEHLEDYFKIHQENETLRRIRFFLGNNLSKEKSLDFKTEGLYLSKINSKPYDHYVTDFVSKDLLNFYHTRNYFICFTLDLDGSMATVKKRIFYL